MAGKASFNGTDGEYGSPYAKRAFDAVKRDVYAFRHRHGEWDPALRARAMGLAQRTIHRFIEKDKAAILAASEIDRIPRDMVKWVEQNVKPRPRRHGIGEGKALRQERIVAWADRLLTGEWPSVRKAAEGTFESHGSAQRALVVAKAQRAAMEAARHLGVDGRILCHVLRDMYRPGHLVAFRSSMLCERLWGEGAGDRCQDLDAPLAHAAAHVGVSAVRYGYAVAVFPLGGKVSEENAKHIYPCHIIPDESPLAANLRNGPFFASEEAMDLWALEAVADGLQARAGFDCYERLVRPFDLVRPDRLLAHVRRSMDTAYQYDRDGAMSHFVMQGIHNALALAELSSHERRT